ncbi:MAG: YccF domain-containing protein [Chloroflexota bacterium]
MAPRRAQTPVRVSSSPNICLRFIWMLFIGWWAGNLALGAAYLLIITIIGFPLGFWIINRLPAIYTLRLSDQLAVSSGDRDVKLVSGDDRQLPWWARIVYFLLVGWWAGGIWANAAYLAGLTIIGLPLSFWMYGRVAAVITLHKT